ncbi:MAG TPA: sigma-54 dependent transcriptional regulator [Kofleriaceae bacterium]|nr:sigma-54 dependent transcriptional regulator [Kofleriaceae bacterium]
MTASILVVDDERGIRSLCGDVLTRAGYDVETAATAGAALSAAAARTFDLILCDINLPDKSGLEVLAEVCARKPAPTVILITAYPTVDTAVRGMKLGARDYLAKPFSPDELRLICGRALDEDALRRENAELRETLAFEHLLGHSDAMAELRATITKIASADTTVLVTGESGTGKELCARALHYHGRRAGKPFVAVNCGALVGSLLESELFGHERGAFTGAERKRRGLMAAAHRGTLFLDEIGELPMSLQPKLLRALQDGEVKPVGGERSETVDIRVIAATNRDLDDAIAGGRFREDLYYRLNVITLWVPPLRDRKADIALLAETFAERVSVKIGTPRPELSPDAIAWLENQPWPGNVRELENAIERAVVLAAGDVLEAKDFAPAGPSRAARATDPDALLSLEQLERAHIERVLAACDGQKTRAAAILGINRTTLWKKLRAYQLD